MAVDDRGDQVLVKAAEEITPGDKSDYLIKTTASVSGLKTAIKVTTLSVSTTELALPATALAKRNSLSIFNKSTAPSVHFYQFF